MSGKKGRKCSMINCDSYQHTHKHLSFFRFPKDPERCKLWIDESGRPDLAQKTAVYEDRICQLHFAAHMFLNDCRNRLHQTAVPSRHLITGPTAPSQHGKNARSAPTDRDASDMPADLSMGSAAVAAIAPPPAKRSRPNHSSNSIAPTVAAAASPASALSLTPTATGFPTNSAQEAYVMAAHEVRSTGMSYRKAADKYGIEFVTLRRFCSRLAKTIGEYESAMGGDGGGVGMPAASASPSVATKAAPSNGSGGGAQNTRDAATAAAAAAAAAVNSAQQLMIQQQQILLQRQIEQHLLANAAIVAAATAAAAAASQQQQQQQHQQTATATAAIHNGLDNIPAAPHQHHIATADNTAAATNASNSNKRPRQIFSVEQEEQLAKYVRETSDYYSGLTSKDVRTMAFVYAVCNRVDIPQGWRDVSEASFDWCLGFIKRNKLAGQMVTGALYKQPPPQPQQQQQQQQLQQQQQQQTMQQQPQHQQQHHHHHQQVATSVPAASVEI